LISVADFFRLSRHHVRQRTFPWPLRVGWLFWLWETTLSVSWWLNRPLFFPWPCSWMGPGSRFRPCQASTATGSGKHPHGIAA
jgi:hypothetical protein